MANYDISKMEDLTVTLTLDDDTELECAVITIFEADGHDYIALLPLEGEDFEDGSVYLYRYAEMRAKGIINQSCSKFFDVLLRAKRG